MKKIIALSLLTTASLFTKSYGAASAVDTFEQAFLESHLRTIENLRTAGTVPETNDTDIAASAAEADTTPPTNLYRHILIHYTKSRF